MAREKNKRHKGIRPFSTYLTYPVPVSFAFRVQKKKKKRKKEALKAELSREFFEETIKPAKKYSRIGEESEGERKLERKISLPSQDVQSPDNLIINEEPSCCSPTC